ncbi:hypothetical protein GCM10007053_02550 [Halioglobus pacificus]|uniref:Uncharacterized protein n=1 Tax=Parahalioglobus pacificus TaxID=930806 RepID=A0A918XCU0_9GAMM|nr:hypothetical protein GCM10007053_02550 [Halioglobus pacificus]
MKPKVTNLDRKWGYLARRKDASGGEAEHTKGPMTTEPLSCSAPVIEYFKILLKPFIVTYYDGVIERKPTPKAWQVG